MEWSLGDLDPGETGTRRLIVDVDAGLADGKLLDAGAVLIDASAPVESTYARAVTRIDVAPPLELHLDTAPDPAAPGRRLNGLLTVVNRSASVVSGVDIHRRLPDFLDDLAEPAADGAFCNSGNTSVCERREEFVWSLGTLNPAQAAPVTISPRVTDAGLVIEPGELIEFVAVARVPGTDLDEAVDPISVPEVGSLAGLAAGIGLLATLAGGRCRGFRLSSACPTG